MKSLSAVFFLLLSVFSFAFSARAERVGGGGAVVPVELNNTLGANDDGSTSAVPLNIGGEGGINFFGQKFTQVFVNNNGNFTFRDSSREYVPNGLSTGVGQPIIAGFFADVDTRGEGSGLVMYGNATVNGYAAFVANYIQVGYYSGYTDRLNSFQVILLDRADTGAGNFDIELNYNQIQWDSTGSSDGISAVAGFSNGLSGSNNVFFQLPGSLVNGAFLDGGPNALIAGKMNSTTPGRYIFEVRNGTVITPPPPTDGNGPLTVKSVVLGTIALGSSISGSLNASGGMPPYSWLPPDSLPAGLTANGGYINGTPAQPGTYNVTLQATDSAGAGAAGSINFSVFGLVDAALPAGILFSPYSASLRVAGGTGPYAYSISGLPVGLSGNVSGVITGSVTKAGSTNVAVTVTDSSTGISVSKTLPLTFAVPPPLAVSASALPAAMMGQTYSQVLSGASGGSPPYTWSIASGSLPDGLSLRPSGTISGLASRPGTYTFGVRATDVTGASAAASATLTIAPVPLLIVAPTLPTGMVTVEFPSQTISALGGVPPYTFSVTGGGTAGNSLGGLKVDSSGTISGTPTAPGSYSFTVTATDSAGNAGTASLALTVRSFSTDLVVSAGSVDFSLTGGSVSLPSPQTFTVQSSTAATAIPYALTISPAAADWVTVSPAAGSTPGSVSVSLNSKAQALPAAATPYQAMISIACLSPAPCQGGSRTVAVNLTVKNLLPQLNVLSDLIAFSSVPGAGPGLTQALGLQNAGGGSIGVSSVSCAATWCSISGIPGSISAGQTANLTVSADPAALTTGYYRTTITVKTSTGAATVPVTLFVSALPDISLQPAGTQFLSLAGGVPNGQTPSFLISVSGSAPVSWTASVLPGASWLSVSTPSGTASSAQPGQVSFALDSTLIAALAPQNYYGTIRVTSTGVTNSPQDFEVVLNIGPANGIQRPNPSPAGLLFLTSANVTAPPQTVTISTSSVLPVSVQVAASTADGANWLSVTPSTGSAQPGAPLQTRVSVDASKLASGVYTGGISYAYTGLAVRTVNVTLIVSSGPKPALVSSRSGSDFSALDNPATLSPRDETGTACSPKLMAVAQTGLVTNFSQPTAWPTPLEMLLVNDCGSPIANGQIVAAFSNGDPPLPLNLADGGRGLYSGTWTPRRAAQQTTITLRATAPGFAPVTTQLAGAVTPNAVPLLARNSTQHIYNPLAAGALAPGTLVQVSGTALSSKSAAAPAGPLPTSLNGTQVLIGGILAPISSVSPGSLNAELPFGLTPGMQYQVIVSANGALTTPDTVQLAGTSPGVAASAGGLVQATHLDGSAVTEDVPAAPGEILVMFGAGLGLTDTPVEDGATAPSSPLANAVSIPALTIDGTPATVLFAGLQPGMVGVYQINFTVPEGAKNGDLTLILSQDGQPGNSTVLPVKAKQ